MTKFRSIFVHMVHQRRLRFKVKFIAYKFLNFFRANVKEKYGIENHNFAKRHQTTLRHAFTAAALSIRSTMQASQAIMRQKGDDIDEYMQKMREKSVAMVPPERNKLLAA